MKFESILIITYARSGSTLLQGILNSIDGCLIRGENEMFCLGLFQSYKALLRAKEKGGQNPNHPWYGAYLLDESVFIHRVKYLVKELLLADRKDTSDIICFGFKEIGYLNYVHCFPEYLEFLTKIMPKVAFIFNTRNLDDVLMSGWWKNTNAGETRAKIQALEQAFDEYYTTHNNCFKITYDDMISKTSNLMAMFDFLGAPYLEERINTVLSTPHSYAPRQTHIKKLFIKKGQIRALFRR